MNKIKQLILILILCFVSIAPALAATSFYHGKTLTVIVPYSTGGGHDTIARLLSGYLKNYLGVARVKVVNKPGGGGLVGDNAVYNSNPNGLTIGVIDNGGVFSQILNQSGVNFDMSKYTILGSPDFSPHVFIVRPNSKYKTFKDVLNSHQPVTVLATGKGGASYELTRLILNGFSIPHKIVAAFKGEHNVVSTFLSGEGDMVVPAIHYLGELGNRVKPIMLVSNTAYSKLSQVPYMAQLAEEANIPQQNKEILKLLAKNFFTDVLVVGPPNIPASRKEALTKALKKTVENPKYIAAAKKEHDVAMYTSGKKMKEAIDSLIQHSSKIRKLAKE